MSQELALTQGKTTLVSDEDYERVSRYHWHAFYNGRKWYVGCRINGRHKKYVYLHRFILDAPDGTEVDHINNDGLDNRRENLRLASRHQNACNQKLNTANTSGFKGVILFRDKKRWQAQIKHLQKNIYIGIFDTPEEAACAYDLRAIELFGEFALTNFPLSNYSVVNVQV